QRYENCAHHFVTNQTVTLTAPPTANGNWQLDLHIVSNANKFSGNASIRFANTNAFNFQLSGSYSPKTQRSRFLLRSAVPGDKTPRLLVAASGPQLIIDSMRGSVAGQSIRFP